MKDRLFSGGHFSELNSHAGHEIERTGMVMNCSLRVWRYMIGLAVVVLAVPPTEFAAANEAGHAAQEILRAAGSSGGLCVHWGCADGVLTSELSLGGKYLVQGIAFDPKEADEARECIQSAGRSGQVSIELRKGAELPYASSLVNVVLVEKLSREVRDAAWAEEAVRVLCPGGVVMVRLEGGKNDSATQSLRQRLRKAGLGEPEVVDAAGDWLKGVKPVPPGMDDWGHYRHRANGNMVSQDKLVGPPDQLQWNNGQRWMRHWLSLGYEMSACGVFAYMKVQPVRVLEVWDAFNGLPLWSKPLPKFTPHMGDYSSAVRQVALADGLLFTVLENSGTLVALRARTGELVREYAEAKSPSEILCDSGVVYAVGRSVSAFEATSGRMKWQAPVNARDVVISDRRIYGVSDRKSLVCLSTEDGKEVWKVELGRSLDLMFSQDGIVVLAEHRKGGPTKQSESVFVHASDDGRQLWSMASEAGKSGYMDVFLANGLVWLPLPEDKGWIGLDPKTGEERKRAANSESGGGQRRCYLFKATERFLIPGDLEFIDLDSTQFVTRRKAGTHRDSIARSACGIGFIPANGLVYATPHGCKCASYVRGFSALGAAPNGDPRAQTHIEEAAEQGPAFDANKPVENGSVDPEAWPCFRHDPGRGGIASTTVPLGVKVQWTRELGAKATPPVIAGGLVLTATVDEHRVHAIDAKTGKICWSFLAGGRVDSSPTLYDGLCLFGCADGWAYAVRASDGVLAWRTRVAPADRYVVSYDRLESSWPLKGSVAICKGKAICSAGRHTNLDGGIHFAALEPRTGRILWRSCASGGGRVADLLQVAGDSVYLGWLRVDSETGKLSEGNPPLQCGEGNRECIFDYDDHQRRLWEARRVAGKLLVFDSERAFGFNMFTRDEKMSAKQGTHTPGQKDNWIFAGQGSGQEAWCVRGDLGVRALLLSGDTLWAAGVTEGESTSGGCLQAFSAADGKCLGKWQLPAPPANDGLAAAKGSLFIVDEQGRVTCFGSQE